MNYICSKAKECNRFGCSHKEKHEFQSEICTIKHCDDFVGDMNRVMAIEGVACVPVEEGSLKKRYLK